MFNSDIERSPDGSLLVYRKGYTVEFVRQTIKKHKLRGLRIFSVLQDQKLGSIDFLREYDFLEALDVTSTEAYDFDFLKNLRELKELSINVPSRIGIDLGNQASLEVLAINWRKDLKGLQSLKSLKEIYISELGATDFTFLQDLIGLKKIVIKGGALKSLDGMKTLSSLESLGLNASRKLSSIRDINGLKNLQFLQLDSCPAISDYAVLNDLPALEELRLDNCSKMETIGFVRNFPSLKRLSLLENTNIVDGDLSPAAHIPDVFHTARRHYNMDLNNSKYAALVQSNLKKIKRLFYGGS